MGSGKLVVQDGMYRSQKWVIIQAGLQILYIWATGLRAKNILGAKNPRKKGENRGKRERKVEGES